MVIAELTSTANKELIINRLADALSYVDGVGKVKVERIEGLKVTTDR